MFLAIGRDTLARNDVRPVIKLRSTAGTGYTYVTRKNRRNDPDRLTLKKYDPIVRRHVLFREDR
ncbi:50S ribosomal protein L33 2 [Acrocarpospora phusangensis]|uniref:Large ribosomal subunit protein bL33 n=1 Tax=Acrocarpospora phusangensis TaxID=1070424 RepID=A0A919Q7C6_9ACTN|nr:50S ribosomal protein L33 2 [Acrocarpospora phusangensis]